MVEESNLFDPDHPGLEEELESLRRHLESLGSNEPSAMETHFSNQAGESRNASRVYKPTHPIGSFGVCGRGILLVHWWSCADVIECLHRMFWDVEAEFAQERVEPRSGTFNT